MKKIFLCLVVSFFIGGYLFSPIRTQDTASIEKPQIYESKISESFSENNSDENVLSEIELAEETNSFTGEDKEALLKNQENNYAFTMLTDTEQNIYIEILYALENQKKEIELSSNHPEEIDKVFQCVLIDHPEIFYTDGYSFVKYTLGNEVRRIIFEPNYIYSKEEIEKRKAKIEEEVKSILEEIPQNASDYEKVKAVYEYIIKNTEYYTEAEDNQNICSVFLEKTSVCQGYAKAVQYLLKKISIPVTLVMGSVENGEGHAWNIVEIEDKYYHLDATWGDASYLFKKEEAGMEHMPIINYDYLCITTEEIERTHRIDPIVPVPFCDARQANYYVMEGAFFTEFNEEQLKQLIQKTMEKGRDSFTIKCLDDKVYNDMIRILLEEQEIFFYLNTESNSIVYSDSRDQQTLTFWLD